MFTVHPAAYDTTGGTRTLIQLAPGIFFSVFSTRYAFIAGLVEYSRNCPRYI